MIDFKRVLRFLIKKKLTFDQFAICWMIETKDIEGFSEYCREVGNFSQRDFQYLIDNDYLLNLNADGKLNIANLIVTPKYTKEVFIDGETALNEIIAIYPKSFKIDGKVWSTLNCDLGLLRLDYEKIIKNNKYKHEEILEKTKIMVERMKNGETNYRGIGKYIRGHNWLEVEYDGTPDDTFTSL